MSDEFPNRVHRCRRDTIDEENVVIADEPLLSKNRVPYFGLRVSSYQHCVADCSQLPQLCFRLDTVSAIVAA